MGAAEPGAALNNPAAGSGPLAGLSGMVPMVLMFLVIYVVMIHPNNKQRRAQQEMLDALKKDDEIVTSSGIYGRIVQFEEKVAILEIADKVKIRLLRSSIASRVNAVTAAPPLPAKAAKTLKASKSGEA